MRKTCVGPVLNSFAQKSINRRAFRNLVEFTIAHCKCDPSYYSHCRSQSLQRMTYDIQKLCTCARVARASSQKSSSSRSYASTIGHEAKDDLMCSFASHSFATLAPKLVVHSLAGNTVFLPSSSGNSTSGTACQPRLSGILATQVFYASKTV